MSSPSKRRRTSPDTYVRINGNEEQPNRTNAAPRRKSFQSPTKASLAKARPQVLKDLMQAKTQRESEPNRRKSLLAAVLGDRPGIQDLEPHVSASEVEPYSTLTTTGEENLHADDVAVHDEEENEDLFDATPDPVEPDTENVDVERAESPPPFIPTPRNRRVGHFSSPIIVPKLVPSASKSTSRRSRSPSSELPPTPVHLQSRSNRPRGLGSSSPSGRASARMRQRQGNVTSSPLKPRAFAPVPSPSESEGDSDAGEIASGLGHDETNDTMRDEAPPVVLGSAMEVEQDLDDDDPDIKQRQLRIVSLEEDLRELTQECDDITSLSSMVMGKFPLQAFPEAEFEQSISSILKSKPSSSKTAQPRIEEHELYKQNADKYLELFSPSDLKLSRAYFTQMIDDRIKTIYEIHLAASDSWPPGTLNLGLNLTVDLATGSTEQLKITRSDSSDPALHQWFETRRQGSTLKVDMPVVVAAVSNFFRENTKRAAVMDAVERESRLGNPDNGDVSLDSNDSTRVAQSQYLNCRQHVVYIGTRSAHSSSHTVPKIMLIYDIQLDVLGQASTKLDICGSGLPAEALKHARRIFCEVSSIDGPVKAMAAVRKILANDERNHNRPPR